MLGLVVIAGLLLVVNHRAMTKAAFLLRRAEISYRQLDGYQRLSIETLEYILAGSKDESARRRRIADEFRNLDRMVTFEVNLARENGDSETNLVESRRLANIESIIEGLLASHVSGPGAADIYQSRLKPLLDEAITNETAETAIVEQAMRQMQHSMLWLAALGILAQLSMAALVLGVVERAVLGPLKRLVSDIREFGRGRLTHRVAVSRHDEFGLFGQHINRMARHLDDRNGQLLAMNASLEATVAERTRALRDRNAELQDIDASRRRFFVDVSHELRTPLTAIVGEADVTLRDRKADRDVCRTALASILANSTYLNRRIDDLMALARSSSGRLELDMQILDLNAVATDAIAEIQSLAKVNQVEVHFKALTRQILVEGDRLRLRQSIMILLDNAVKFSPAFRSVTMHLSVDASEARLAITDQGRGIDTQALEVVFERFFQTEVGRRKGGTGLGLAIARRMIGAHHGTIEAARADGGGTTMTITLPLRENSEK